MTHQTKTLTIHSVEIGEGSGQYLPLTEDADISQYETTLIKDWEFEHIPMTTGTLLDAASRRRIPDGAPGDRLDAALCYAVVHLVNLTGPNEAYSKTGVNSPITSLDRGRAGSFREDPPSPAFVRSLPPMILLAFFDRANRVPTPEEVAAMKIKLAEEDSAVEQADNGDGNKDENKETCGPRRTRTKAQQS